MNSSETNSQTPLRYKNRLPAVHFFSKNGKALLSRSNCQATNLMSLGQHSRKFKETNSFHIFPVVKTPPTKRLAKVVNPFEAALTERLHLPLIGSPTLFQRPPTPQHSSTQFTWTIDDVSSLQPANVEPYEAQFHDSPDPEYEAKAQSAISSYFKDQQIVPSPIDCPLRSQRIMFSELSGNTPISKPGRRLRDNFTQTVLSLPPVLPKDLETALAPYFFFNENQQSTSIVQNISNDGSISAIDHDIRDASLRRKLFDYQSVMYMDDDNLADAESCMLTVSSPTPQSPEVVNSKHISSDEPFYNSKLSDSMDKSSFGSLSPVQCSSPPNLKRKSRINMLNSSKSGDSLSGPFFCLPVSNALGNTENSLKISPLCRVSTPDLNLSGQSFSPYQAASEMLIDSIFNVKISGVLVDTTIKKKTSLEIDLFGDETRDEDEDDMQVSQLSTMSNISSESDTPRSKRRSASRKNLSQSFSFQYCSNNEDELDCNNDLKESNNAFFQVNQSLSIDDYSKSQFEQIPSERLTFCRTDSGFNEMTTSSTNFDIPNGKTGVQLAKEEETADKHAIHISDGDADVSMICCSTPSKHT